MEREQRAAQEKWNQLRDEGDIMSFKPDTTAQSAFEPLPEGDYTFVVVRPEHWVVEMPDWKKAYALENWNDRQKVRESEGKPVQFFEKPDDLPFDKQNQIVLPLVVAEGEHKGRRLPAQYISMRLNTDPQFMEKSNWYRILKTLVPKLKDRAVMDDLPDFDTEVVGFRGIAEVEITAKGKNKVTAYRKHDKHFGKRMDDLELAALALAAGLSTGDVDTTPADENGEIPF